MSFPVDVTTSGTYPYLKRLVLTGDFFVHLQSDELLEIQQNDTRITQTRVPVEMEVWREALWELLVSREQVLSPGYISLENSSAVWCVC